MSTMSQHNHRVVRRGVRANRQIKRAEIVPPGIVVDRAWTDTGQAIRKAMDQHLSTLN